MSKEQTPKPKFMITADDFKNLSTEQLLMRLVLAYLVANEVVSSGMIGG